MLTFGFSGQFSHVFWSYSNILTYTAVISFRVNGTGEANGPVCSFHVCIHPPGWNYRLSTSCVTIRITNRCDFLYYVFISFFSSFPYMFRAFTGPSSGVFQAVVFMLSFGSCSALSIVCVRQRTGLWWWLRCLIVTHIKDARYEKPKVRQYNLS